MNILAPAEDGLTNFFEKNYYLIRKATTVSQKLPSDLDPTVQSFIKLNANLIFSHKINRAPTGNMDEAAIWSDMPCSSTIASKGSKSVPLFSTRNEKQITIVALSAMADGQKLFPYIIFKGKLVPN